MEIQEALKEAYEAISDKKGENIAMLDISEISFVADYFIIATGRNTNHVQTLADAAEEKLAKMGVPLKHKEGYKTATWILLDFGSIIAHIFTQEERDFYNLEHIWADAGIVDANELQ